MNFALTTRNCALNTRNFVLTVWKFSFQMMNFAEKDQLAEICRIKARRMFDRDFEDGLEEKLAVHIGDFYAREIPQQNAGLSVNLTEAAVDRQVGFSIDFHCYSTVFRQFEAVLRLFCD